MWVVGAATHHPVCEMSQVAEVQQEGKQEGFGSTDPRLVPLHGLADVCQVVQWWLDAGELHSGWKQSREEADHLWKGNKVSQITTL